MNFYDITDQKIIIHLYSFEEYNEINIWMGKDYEVLEYFIFSVVKAFHYFFELTCFVHRVEELYFFLQINFQIKYVTFSLKYLSI